MGFQSIVWCGAGRGGGPPENLRDLGLDLVVGDIVKGREHLRGLYLSPPQELEDALYRQRVFADLLADPGLVEALRRFTAKMRSVLGKLREAEENTFEHQADGVFVGAVLNYCSALRELVGELAGRTLVSEGLRGLREYLQDYVSSERFRNLCAGAQELSQMLRSVRFRATIKDGSITVYRAIERAEDYGAQIEGLFERFAGMGGENAFSWKPTYVRGHVEAAVLSMVAKLFPKVFGRLAEFHRANRGFPDRLVVRFHSEIEFYLAYLDYIAPLRARGLGFCLPELVAGGGGYRCVDGFDLALASRLVKEGGRIVPNSFELGGPERIIVVTGPNGGGKTTFARMVGQLHYLAKLGLPVPGKEARLLFCDQVYTHFPAGEDVENLRGKLEDDLIRIRRILERATPRSLIVINEMLASTSVSDAAKIGRKILEKIARLGCLCVCVTFVEELAKLNGVASYIAQVDPQDPETRTFRIVRGPPTGLAHALSLARKHGLTYRQVLERIRA